MSLIPNNLNPSKRVQINKDQATAVGVVAAAVFVSVFSLVSSKSLLTQRAYQQRIITKQEKARDNLKSSAEALTQLEVSYKDFTSTPDNVIGGNPTGTGDKDGDNAKIVLDALPSKYDYPAWTSSLEKILTDRKFKIGGISGTDDELAQQPKQTSSSPKPIEIPFSVSVNGSYQSIQGLVDVFEKSIRPIKIKRIDLSGGASDMQFSVQATTYYQPEKIFDVKSEVVK